jgi:alkylhydroperoxidase family enzyme
MNEENGGDRFDSYIRALVRAAAETPGHLDPVVRRAIQARSMGRTSTEVAEPLAAFVDLIAHRPSEVSDADVETLRQAEFSEDAIFEATVCAAVGAGVLRWERGMAAVRSTGS